MAHFNASARFISLGLCLLLTACASVQKTSQDSAPSNPKDVAHVPDAVPKVEAHSRYGNPDSYEVFGKRYYTKDSSHGYVAQGQASWYGTKFHGNRTSSGEPYDMYEMTAAHKTLPLPTYARVTNVDNGKSVVVKINDRGPFHGDRIIDLSYAAASRIGILEQGTGHVKVEAITANHAEQTLAEAKAAPKPAAAPAAVTQTASTTSSQSPEWYLQLAAFGDKTYAENMVSELEGIIEQPMHINQGGRSSLYRVQVGPFADRSSASAYQQQLAALVPEKPMLVTQ